MGLGIKKIIAAVKTLKSNPFSKAKLKNCKHKIDVNAADLFSEAKPKKPTGNYRVFPDKPEPTSMTLTYQDYDAEKIKNTVAAWSQTINTKV